MEFQKIRIEGIEYYIVDSIQNLRAEDSFIHPNNKLQMFKGSGEARKYVGRYTGKNGDRLKDFFEYQDWGDTKGEDEKRVYPIISKNCFFSKKNLHTYIYDAQDEYHNPNQKYNNDILHNFHRNLKELKEIDREKISFSIYDISDLINATGNRAYIRSDSYIWELWRKLILPKMSYLSILKLIPIYNTDSQPIYYFRILLDHKFRFNKVKKSIGRLGASKYREDVIKHMPKCPFTGIDEKKLLIASHIKPYQVCINEDREDQAIDYFNGLSLSPTYDKLFDQGYITFTDKGELLCGTQLSAYTWEKLNINPNAKNKMRIYPEDREEYLEYHRKFVFQDNVEDIMLD